MWCRMFLGHDRNPCITCSSQNENNPIIMSSRNDLHKRELCSYDLGKGCDDPERPATSSDDEVEKDWR